MAGQPHAVHDRPRSSGARFIGIVIVFLLVGPPVGGIATWVITLAVEISRGHSVAGPGAIIMLVYMVLFSYPVGGLLALAAGIVHAIAAIRLLRYSAVVPVVAACVASLIGATLMAWLQPGFSGAEAQFKAAITLLLPVSLIASGVCWHFTRGLARAQ